MKASEHFNAIIARIIWATLYRNHRRWRERVYLKFVSNVDEHIGPAWKIFGDGSNKPLLSYGFSKITGTMLFQWKHQEKDNQSYLYRLGSRERSDGYSVYNLDYSRRLGDLLFPAPLMAVTVVALVINPDASQEDVEKLHALYSDHIVRSRDS